KETAPNGRGGKATLQETAHVRNITSGEIVRQTSVASSSVGFRSAKASPSRRQEKRIGQKKVCRRAAGIGPGRSSVGATDPADSRRGRICRGCWNVADAASRSDPRGLVARDSNGGRGRFDGHHVWRPVPCRDGGRNRLRLHFSRNSQSGCDRADTGLGGGPGPKDSSSFRRRIAG